MPGPPVDEDPEVVTRQVLQHTLEQLLQVLDGLQDLKTAVDMELGDPRPDAKIIPFPRSPKTN